MGAGPIPRKDTNQQLNPNSADQFDKVNQGEYEARSREGDESKNIDEVIENNNVYPKLRNELHKRRSAVEIKACSTQKNDSDRRCSACEKLRQLAELKRLKLKPKCQGNRKRVYLRKGGVRKNKRIKKKLKIHNSSGRRKIYKSRNAGSDSKDGDSVVSSLRNPDTNHSVSSFNSFPSSGLGQEPMDS